MSQSLFKYIIVGGGLAGASAVEGIREIDRDGSILLIGRESRLPYHRPPLSKKLWTGAKKVEDIFVHDHAFYDGNKVELALGTEVKAIDSVSKAINTIHGKVFRYEKLLLATGGEARRMDIPGGDLDGVVHFRNLDDYLRSSKVALEGRSAVVVGGGFIGSEMAAALNMKKMEVAMIFQGPYLCRKVFPESLGRAIQQNYGNRGIRVLAGDFPTSIERSGERLIVSTRNGESVKADLVIVGVGLRVSMELARDAGLGTGDGIVVNEYLQTSNPDIFAAGDIANFPYKALGKRMRVEHWDNALNQGKQAGRNMAGANEKYDYMPYFFSDLFDFGYEAVGDVDASLETFADWKEENRTGVVYYLDDGKVMGVMMCNVWDKVEAARELIRKDDAVSVDNLRGAIA
jgi:NADPH-dependent 2,4-dienoyl-CoA reductase/sulfur reductase-like enzyme